MRGKISGTAIRPRLSIFRSNRHVWMQLMDDTDGKTLLAASDWDSKNKGKKAKKTERAYALGEQFAKKALEQKINTVVFDRGGYKYHGIIKAVAEGARKGGLQF